MICRPFRREPGTGPDQETLLLGWGMIIKWGSLPLAGRGLCPSNSGLGSTWTVMQGSPSRPELLCLSRMGRCHAQRARAQMTNMYHLLGVTGLRRETEPHPLPFGGHSD